MIQVIDKAARALAVISREPGIDLKRLAATLGLKKPGLLQMLRTLVSVGFLRKDEGGGYCIGQGLCDIVRPTLAAETLERVANRHASGLAEAVGEDVTIACLRDGERRIAARGSAEQSVVVDPGHEARLRVDKAATGLVLLAYLQAEKRAEFVERNGLAVCDDLAEKLALVRENGYARVVSDDGHAYFLAVPVSVDGDEVIAAVGVSVPSVRLDDDREAWLIERMRSSSSALGQSVMKMSESMTPGVAEN